MRPHRRRDPLPHLLVAADVTETAAIQPLLDRLPAHAYGQVYVEGPTGAEHPTLRTPPRVLVTRLERTPADADRPGDRLTAAVAGWMGEWMPDEWVVDRELTVWVGATVRADLAGLDGRLQHL